LSTFAAVVVSRPRLLLSCLSFLAVYSLVKLPGAALAAPCSVGAFPRRSTSTAGAAHPPTEPRCQTKTARYTGLPPCSRRRYRLSCLCSARKPHNIQPLSQPTTPQV